MIRWSLKRARGIAHEIGWGLTTSEPGFPKKFKFFVKRPGKKIVPFEDLRSAAMMIVKGRNAMWEKTPGFSEKMTTYHTNAVKKYLR